MFTLSCSTVSSVGRCGVIASCCEWIEKILYAHLEVFLKFFGSEKLPLVLTNDSHHHSFILSSLRRGGEKFLFHRVCSPLRTKWLALFDPSGCLSRVVLNSSLLFWYRVISSFLSYSKRSSMQTAFVLVSPGLRGSAIFHSLEKRVLLSHVAFIFHCKSWVISILTALPKMASLLLPSSFSIKKFKILKLHWYLRNGSFNCYIRSLTLRESNKTKKFRHFLVPMFYSKKKG